MHILSRSLLITTLVLSGAMQSLGMEENKKEVQQPKVFNTQLTHTAPATMDKPWCLIALHALETRKDFYNFSLVSKQFYKVMHCVANQCGQLSFLERLNNEAIDPAALHDDNSPIFRPNEFSLYFGLVNDNGTPNIDSVKGFEKEKGSFVSLWLGGRYSNVFNRTFDKAREGIVRDSNKLSFNESAHGCWYFRAPIRLVPLNILTVANCIRLGFTGCGLLELPKGLSQMPKVEELELSCNEFETLPSDSQHMTKLTKLVLAYNKFRVFPKEVLGMTSLRELNCGWEGGVCNLFSDLPTDLSSLTKLEDLSLTGCRFESVPPQVSQLTGLNTFRIDNNGLKSVGPELFTLTNLTSLFLQNNKLTTLPENMGNLINVTWLFLCANELTELPESIWQMKALKNLQLGRNKLKVLSTGVLTLPNLEELEVGNNQITCFPQGFSKMTTLKKLNLSDNPVGNPASLVADLNGFRTRGTWANVTFYPCGGSQGDQGFTYTGN